MRGDAMIREIDPEYPDASLIREAADTIKSGGMIVFPTRTLYGIGVDPFNKESVRRVFKVKHRAESNPISVLVKSVSEIKTLVEEIPGSSVVLMEQFWPGQITLIFKAAAHVPKNLSGGSGKIGIRVPEHPVAAILVNSLKQPITGTSANLSGSPGVSRINDLPDEILRNVDLVLDAGQLKGGEGSTVVDITKDPPEVLREGSVLIKAL